MYNVPGSIKVEVKVFGKAQKQRRVYIAPVHGVGCKVITLANSEVLYKRHFFLANRVVLSSLSFPSCLANCTDTVPDFPIDGVP